MDDLITNKRMLARLFRRKARSPCEVIYFYVTICAVAALIVDATLSDNGGV